MMRFINRINVADCRNQHISCLPLEYAELCFTPEYAIYSAKDSPGQDRKFFLNKLVRTSVDSIENIDGISKYDYVEIIPFRGNRKPKR